MACSEYCVRSGGVTLQWNQHDLGDFETFQMLSGDIAAILTKKPSMS